MLLTARDRHIVPDIEGLRAVAVLVVLLYHAHLGAPGGFVGVDVFFVISGYLITGLIAREIDASDRVSLASFYARRARRLLPAATVVLLATLALAVAFLDPLRRARTATDALWAGGFVANVRFAVDGADYFATGTSPSLLQHWWSLAVEEQFYVAWPVLLGVAWAIARRVSPHRGRRGAIALAVVVIAVSFPVSVAMTSSSPSWAYFATWSRAWELAAGGLIALCWRGHTSPIVRVILRWVGLGTIAFAVAALSNASAFPGWWALVPCVGACAVLMSIDPSPESHTPSRFLSARSMQWVGARSYGLYLWHWPLLMVVEERMTDPSPLVRAGVLIVAVVASALMYGLIENPIRFSSFLVRSRARSLAVGAVLTALALVGAVSVRSLGTSATTGFTADTVLASAPTPTTTGPTSTDMVLAPFDELERRITAELHPLIDKSASLRLVPDNVRPSLASAPDDKVDIFSNDCMAGFRKLVNPPCLYGEPSSETAIALFGDSHAAQWFPALESIAVRNGFAFHALTKMGCPSVGVSVRRDLRRDYPECDTWRTNTLARIARSDIDLVIVSNYRYRRAGVPKGTITEAEWGAGLDRTVGALLGAGKKVVLLSDTPTPGVDIPECLSKNLRRVDRCTRPTSSTVNEARRRTEQRVATARAIPYVDTTRWVCTQVCPPIVGNLLVYLDNNHLTNTFANFLEPYLELAIKGVM